MCCFKSDHINRGGGQTATYIASYMYIGDVPMTTIIKYCSFSDSSNAKNITTIMTVAGRDILM